MMPHHGCRSKSNLIALLQKAPADIDIIAGLTKLMMKATNRCKHASLESHVATRHVLGRLVIEHYMAGISGACRDAFCDPVVVGRTEIRPANGIDALLQHAMS